MDSGTITAMNTVKQPKNIDVRQILFTLEFFLTTAPEKLGEHLPSFLFHMDFRVRDLALRLIQRHRVKIPADILFSLYTQTKIKEEKLAILSVLSDIITGTDILWPFYHDEHDRELKLQLLKTIAAADPNDKILDTTIRNLLQNKSLTDDTLIDLLEIFSHYGTAADLKQYTYHKNPLVVNKAVSVWALRNDDDARRYLTDLSKATAAITSEGKAALLEALHIVGDVKSMESFLLRTLHPQSTVEDSYLKGAISFIDRRLTELSNLKSLLRNLFIVRRTSDWYEEKIIQIFRRLMDSRDARHKSTLAELSDSILRSFERNASSFHTAREDLQTRLPHSQRTDAINGLKFAEEYFTRSFMDTFLGFLNDEVAHHVFLERFAEYKAKVAAQSADNLKALIRIVKIEDPGEKHKVAKLLREYIDTAFEQKRFLLRLLALIGVLGRSGFNTALSSCWKTDTFRGDVKLRTALIEAMTACGHPSILKMLDNGVRATNTESVLFFINTLTFSKSPEAVAILHRYIHHFWKIDHTVVNAALDALEHFRGISRAATNRLIQELLPLADKKRGILKAIGLLEPSELADISFIVSYTENEDPDIRIKAITFLGIYFDANPSTDINLFLQLLFQKARDVNIRVRTLSTAYLLKYRPDAVMTAFLDIVRGNNIEVSKSMIELAAGARSLAAAKTLVAHLVGLSDGVYDAILDLLRALPEDDRQMVASALFNRYIPSAPITPEGHPVFKLERARAEEEFVLLQESMRHLTVFFIDITGYTRIASRLSFSELLDLLKNFKDIVVPAVRFHNGQVLQRVGDEYMSIFESAVQACYAAIQIQQELEKYNRYKFDDHKIVTHVGLNTGPVIVRGNDIYGDTVNVASRMESNAEPGTILIPQATYNEVADNVDCEKLPAITVKNKDHPIQVYRVTGARDESALRGKLDADHHHLETAYKDLHPAAKAKLLPQDWVQIKNHIAQTFNAIMREIKETSRNERLQKSITTLIHDSWRQLNDDLEKLKK